MNNIRLLLFCLILQGGMVFGNTDMPEPYHSTPTLPLFMHGWFGPTNQRYLRHFIQQYRPQIVVELGSWMGLSTIFMAQHMQQGAKLYAVDTWLGSVEHRVEPQFSCFLPTLYQQFLSNCKHHGVTNIVIPVRRTTLEAARMLSICPNLVYVDASHAEEDVYNDIMAWYPKLASKGILCGDDWGWESVQKGVIRAAKDLQKTFKTDDNFWFFDF